MIKKISSLIFAVVALAAVFIACDDDVTYAEMLKSENKAISSFIKKGCHVTAEDGASVMLHVDPIKEISEEEFEKNGFKTDTATNEYVLFANSGVYMQIRREGTGSKIKDGENCQVICRFHEYNISADSLQLSNRVVAFEQMPDVMSVSNQAGIYTAMFTSGLMYSVYGSAVPNGWLKVFPYINLGRQTSEKDEIAQVRLIVPSSEGQKTASTNIYGCFYEITMQRGR